jgi:hypothetical protein
MTNIPQDQALKRWDTLPFVLREALCAEENSDFLWKTCSDEHIPEAKIPEVAKASGYVLFGFLHPEDIADEITDRLNIDKKISAAIADALDKRIFTPLRPEIDKIYQPLSKLDPSAKKIIQDIGPAIPMPSPAAGSSPMVFQTSLTTPTVKTTPLSMPPPAAPAPAKAPVKVSPLAEKGWSKISSADPVIKFGVSRSTMPTPAVPAAAPTAPTQAAVNPQKGQSNYTGEFGRLSGSAMPSAPTTPAQAGPVVLQETAKFSSAQKNSDFHLARPPEVSMAGTVAQTAAPIKPAVIEFGKSSSSQNQGIPKPQPAGPVAPPMPSAGRNVTEMTTLTATPAPVQPQPTQAFPKPPAMPIAPSAPMPPSAPVPPAPQMMSNPPMQPSSQPKPPQPPQSPKANVITKDYV